MAVVTADALLTIATIWDVTGTRTRSIGASLTVTAEPSSDAVVYLEALTEVAATATADCEVIHDVDAALEITATSDGDGTCELSADASLGVFVSPTAVVNSLTYTPSPARTWRVPNRTRTFTVTATPKRLSQPRPFAGQKDPDAVLDFTLDWSGELVGGDTIVSAVFTPEDGITATSTSFTDTTTTVRLSAGTDDTTYEVPVHITTAAGRQDDRVLEVAVAHEVAAFRSTKDPDAVLDYTLDWTRVLDTGDTISAAVFTPDSGITIDSDSFTDTTTTVWLSGGEDGTTYEVSVHITTAGGQEDDRVIEIAVLHE